MNKEFWSKHYKDNKITEPSSFAKLVAEKVQGSLVDIGCGDGRDLYYFLSKGIQAHGVDASNEDVSIIKQSIIPYTKDNESPDNVYARFFWHAIEREEQLAVLEWTKKHLFIEARTILDKPKNIIGKHDRNLVNTDKLKKDLEKHGFKIHSFEEGYGLSLYKGEDPHLFRVVAEKML